ncbi:putative transposase [Streptomyces albidoflavus]|nr:putative transposase [Streptomyces albidoflavus]
MPEALWVLFRRVVPLAEVKPSAGRRSPSGWRPRGSGRTAHPRNPPIRSRRGPHRRRLAKLHADKGYDCDHLRR